MYVIVFFLTYLMVCERYGLLSLRRSPFHMNLVSWWHQGDNESRVPGSGWFLRHISENLDTASNLRIDRRCAPHSIIRICVNGISWCSVLIVCCPRISLISGCFHLQSSHYNIKSNNN